MNSNNLGKMYISDDLVDSIILYLPKAAQRSLILEDKLGLMAFSWYYRAVYIGRSITPPENGTRSRLKLNQNLWIFRPKRRPHTKEDPSKVDVSYYDKRFEEPIFETAEAFERFLLETPNYRPKKIVVKSKLIFKQLLGKIPDLRSRCDTLVLQLEENEGFDGADIQLLNPPHVVLRDWGTNDILLEPGVKRVYFNESRSVHLNKDLEELFAVNSNIHPSNLNTIIEPKRMHLSHSLFDHKYKFQSSLKSLLVSPYEGQSLEDLTQLEDLSIEPVSSVGTLKLPTSLRRLCIEQHMLLRDLNGLDLLPNLTSLSLTICMLENPEQFASVKLPPTLRKLMICGMNDNIYSGSGLDVQNRMAEDIYPNLDLFIDRLHLPHSLTELEVSDCPVDMGKWSLPDGLVSLNVSTIFTIGATSNPFKSLKYLRITNVARLDSLAFPSTLRELEVYASEPDSAPYGTLGIQHLANLRRLVVKDNQFVELKLPDLIEELIVKEQSLGEFRCPKKVEYLHLTTSAELIVLSESLKEAEIEALIWKNLDQLEHLSDLIALRALITVHDLTKQAKLLLRKLNKLRYVLLNGFDYSDMCNNDIFIS